MSCMSEILARLCNSVEKLEQFSRKYVDRFGDSSDLDTLDTVVGDIEYVRGHIDSHRLASEKDSCEYEGL